ncbi:interleukin-8-like [Pygocentrus nattereri]|uniref:interleukin-8-like n=1 Tax=Pygocentrus nattereri TaxID=42514 RepID=UPI0018915A8F|nr:interleukin-8-like [Pygocentrus nattereri]
MDSRIVMVCLLLTVFPLTEGMGPPDLECRCKTFESKRIGRLIESVELFPPNPHCKETEIIATLKNTGKEICLDATAPWVMKVIEKIMPSRSP